jgi:hypothetical protein
MIVVYNRFLSLFIALSGLLGALAASCAEDRPFSSPRFDPAKHWRSADLERGMKGYGLTVFQGTQIERFDVEILGVLQNEWSETDMILARVTGGPLVKTGVIAGMSGSPIYIDEKVVGALAYAWGFSKDSIAGITPIENMLPVLDLPATERDEAGGEPLSNPGARSDGAEKPSLLYSTPSDWSSRLQSFLLKDHSGALTNPVDPYTASNRTRLPDSNGFESKLTSVVDSLLSPFEIEGPKGWFPLATPLSISGLSPTVIDHAAKAFSPFGLAPAPGGLPSAYREEKVELEPGSAVGVALVRGDLEMAGIGTVTYRDEDSILAFGHPMFQDGSTDLPLTNAYINDVIASLNISTKMGAAIEVVGALEQDRLTAIGGQVGAECRMLPVEVRIDNRSAGLARSFRYDVAYHRFYTPRFAMFCVLDSLEVVARGFRDSTADYTLTLHLEDRDSIVLEDRVSSPGGVAFPIALTLMDAADIMMRNPYEKVTIEKIEIAVSIVDRLNRGTIEWIRLENPNLEEGDTLRLQIAVQNFLGELETHPLEIDLPPDSGPGAVQITVSDALNYLVESMKRNPDHFRARNLEDLLELVRDFKRDDRVYVQIAALTSGVSYFGNEMEDLPTSVLRIMADSPDRGTGVFLRTKTVAEKTAQLDRPVSGVQRIMVEVKPRRSEFYN